MGRVWQWSISRRFYHSYSYAFFSSWQCLSKLVFIPTTSLLSIQKCFFWNLFTYWTVYKILFQWTCYSCSMNSMFIAREWPIHQTRIGHSFWHTFYQPITHYISIRYVYIKTHGTHLFLLCEFLLHITSVNIYCVWHIQQHFIHFTPDFPSWQYSSRIDIAHLDSRRSWIAAFIQHVGTCLWHVSEGKDRCFTHDTCQRHAPHHVWAFPFADTPDASTHPLTFSPLLGIEKAHSLFWEPKRLILLFSWEP